MLEYMTTKEKAKELGISERRIQQLCKAGYIDSVIKVGRQYLIPSAFKKISADEINLIHFFPTIALPLSELIIDNPNQNFIDNDQRLLFNAEVYTYKMDYDSALDSLKNVNLDNDIKKISYYRILHKALISKRDCEGIKIVRQKINEMYLNTTNQYIAFIISIVLLDLNMTIVLDAKTINKNFHTNIFKNDFLAKLPFRYKPYVSFLYLFNMMKTADARYLSGFIEGFYIFRSDFSGYEILDIHFQIILAIAYIKMKNIELAKKLICDSVKRCFKDNVLFPIVRSHSAMCGLDLFYMDENQYRRLYKIWKKERANWSYVRRNLTNSVVIDTLTEREIAVYNLSKYGYSNSEIADALNLSLDTVKSYFSSIYQKLQVDGRKDLSELVICFV